MGGHWTDLSCLDGLVALPRKNRLSYTICPCPSVGQGRNSLLVFCSKDIFQRLSHDSAVECAAQPDFHTDDSLIDEHS